MCPYEVLPLDPKTMASLRTDIPIALTLENKEF